MWIISFELYNSFHSYTTQRKIMSKASAGSCALGLRKYLGVTNVLRGQGMLDYNENMYVLCHIRELWMFAWANKKQVTQTSNQ